MRNWIEISTATGQQQREGKREIVSLSKPWSNCTNETHISCTMQNDHDHYRAGDFLSFFFSFVFFLTATNDVICIRTKDKEDTNVCPYCPCSNTDWLIWHDVISMWAATTTFDCLEQNMSLHLCHSFFCFNGRIDTHGQIISSRLIYSDCLRTNEKRRRNDLVLTEHQGSDGRIRFESLSNALAMPYQTMIRFHLA